MGKINVLDSSVFNRIAAGEVVDKPASVVKEMIENSIDAKATDIVIEIENGGKKFIRVTDNGSGIEEDDILRVFLPHSTSKIKTVEDLEKIGTLGFRGEALASICSVSDMKLITKPHNYDMGRTVEVKNAQLSEIITIGAKDGTTFVCENIFSNIPAREKFLRKSKLEENDITFLVQKYIMSHSDICFTYIVDGKEILKSFGNGLKEALYIIYKNDILDNIVEVSSSFGDKRLSGYISKPTFSKANRTYQSLFINGRYVNNSLVSTAVQRAYEPYMMKGQFPFFCLNLEIDLDKIDVNVHPNKLDVKFLNSSDVFSFVYTTVSNALVNASVKVSEQIILPNEVAKVIEKSDEQNKFSGISYNESSKSKKVTINSNKYDLLFDDANKNSSQIDNDLNIISSASKDNTLSDQSSFLSKIFQERAQKSYESVHTQSFLPSEFKVVGNCFDTYQFVEFEDNLYIIDQHAFHERMLYDKFSNDVKNKNMNTQMLLVPYIFSVNEYEEHFLLDNVDSINELGFEIESFGENKFKINAIPEILKGIDLENFVQYLLSEIEYDKKLNNFDIIKEKVMQTSCKAAIKAGDTISVDELKKLIEQVKDKKLSLQCPHGRPIVITITKKEIEKWFKRIV